MAAILLLGLQIILLSQFSSSDISVGGIVGSEVFARHQKLRQKDYQECGQNKKLDRGTVFIYKEDEKDEIEGGPGTWPWLVSIGEMGELWKHSCGGSLITRKHVLTAAHCPMQLSVKIEQDKLLVRAGDANLKDNADDSGVQMVSVASYKNHPYYKPTLRYFDVGVLLLAKSLSLTPYVRLICPPPQATLRGQDNHDHLVVAGWGENKGMKAGKQLTNTNVQVYSESYCNRTHLGQTKYKMAIPQGFTEDLFCGGDPAGSEGICHGDSGSPAVLFLGKKYVLKGVVSGGLSCGTKYHPNIYVRLGSKDVLNWIHQQVRSFTKNPANPYDNSIKKPKTRISSGWQPWSSWSSCSRRCGIGKKSRKRLCKGSSCTHKQQSQQRLCNTQRCT